MGGVTLGIAQAAPGLDPTGGGAAADPGTAVHGQPVAGKGEK
jgi:hypothetical protein